MANRVILVIEAERGKTALTGNVNAAGVGGHVEPDSHLQTRLSSEQLRTLLDQRVEMMRSGAAEGGVTDQFRVYQYIVQKIESGDYLRLMVQASAGTGKSFLLTTVYLFCIVKGLKTKAAAPTGP